MRYDQGAEWRGPEVEGGGGGGEGGKMAGGRYGEITARRFDIGAEGTHHGLYILILIEAIYSGLEMSAESLPCELHVVYCSAMHTVYDKCRS